jgi:hypothetical protein
MNTIQPTQNFQIAEGFKLVEGKFCGREAVLINPFHSDAGWTANNLNFRSIVIDKNTNEVLSNSFPKFFNEGQSPELYPDPLKFNDLEIIEKIDGSTLILDYVDGVYSMRTRGIINYITQVNSTDFDELFVKYPLALDLSKSNPNITFLFEIVTPNNRIVIDYGDKVDFYFIGGVNKKNGELLTESALDKIADAYSLKRPKRYDFNNIDDLREIVKNWKSGEGVVVTYNKGQNKIKIKSDKYCFLHRIMSGLCSKKNILDKFIELGFPTYLEFFKFYETEFDYEIAEKIKDDMLLVVNAYNRVLDSLKKINKFVDGLRGESFGRKEQAVEITKHWSDWRAGVAFKILDNKEIEEKFIKKGIEFYLEKQNNEIQTS